jgi:GT2 family glycosyltransferase
MLMSAPSGLTVCAVVITHDRRALLRECLQAIEAQTRQADALLVVDNASSDGSVDLVREEFPQAELMALQRNEGSAGGFHEGLKWGLERGYDWVWVMDGDCIPTPTALERLLDALDQLDDLPTAVMLASKVLWTDGTTVNGMHPQNIPAFKIGGEMDLFTAGMERGLPPLRVATFASVLFKREVIAKHGLPLKHYFMWSDDTEYTARLMRDNHGYFVPSSVAYHKSPTAHAPWDCGDRFYYAVRNGLFFLRTDSYRPKERVSHGLIVAEQTRRYLLTERFSPHSLRIVARGLKDGLLRKAA